MFIAGSKEQDKIVKVYNVVNDKCGFPMFLIYRDNMWLYRSAKHFEPIENN